MDIVEIKPGRVRVDLEEATPLLGSLDHLVEVNRVARPFAEQPPGRVREDVEMAIVHRIQDASSLLLDAELEPEVNGADGEVETLQNAVGQVELAIRENVDLARPQQPKIVGLIVQSVDCVELGAKPLGVEAMRHGGVPGMICDSEILVAQLLRRFRHLGEAAFAIGSSSVDVEVAADVRERDECGEGSLLGNLDLSAVFAQFRFDVGQPGCLEDLEFGTAGYPLLTLEDPVFVEFRPLAWTSLRTAILWAFDPVK